MPFTRTQIAERVAAAKEEYDDDDGWTKTDWDKWAKKELRAEQEAATAGEKEWVVQEEAAPKGGARAASRRGRALSKRTLRPRWARPRRGATCSRCR